MVSAMLVGFALVVTGAAKPAEADRAAYESARAAAGRDAEAHVALALWCEAHGMAAEKATHLARAVLLDPSNARARGLLGYVQRDGRWMRPEEVSKAVEESPEFQALFREYQQRRTQSADRADDQYKLARWCDKHGLAQQATAHYHRVVEIDPGRESAWKHLGFKKVSGRWVKPEVLAAEKAEREAQEKADRFWKPKLEKIKEALSSRNKAKRAEAEEALAAIADPRAVPMVWSVFARGDENRQRVALRVLRQIDAPDASIGLATLAMFSPWVGIRSEAAQSLTRRDTREYARFLVMLLADEVKYEKRDVAGPGSRGELLVEGKDANVRRVYTPLGRPVLSPGDWTHLDAYGNVVAERLIPGPIYFDWSLPVGTNGAVIVSSARRRMALLSSVLQTAGLSADQSETLVQRSMASSTPIPADASFRPFGAVINAGALTVELSKDSSEANLRRLGGPNFRQAFMDHVQIPIQRMMEEARFSALVAQQQLARDVQQIEQRNTPVREINERATAILKTAAGRDMGDDRDKWFDWLYDLEGVGTIARSSSPPPPTIVEEVPIAFQPLARPMVVPEFVGYIPSGITCFAAGTSVRTLHGPRPIEAIRPGDELLTQDTTTGKLEYHPVVTVFHNPPNWTYRIDLGDEALSPTGVHRFWKAGSGWVMARDLKPGDRLRTIGGTAEVRSVTKDRVQPVFNLLLSGGDDFCVGQQGVLAHDNALPGPVDRPFDDVPALADLGAAAKP
jgi:hypothetical protein